MDFASLCMCFYLVTVWLSFLGGVKVLFGWLIVIVSWVFSILDVVLLCFLGYKGWLLYWIFVCVLRNNLMLGG